uniref:Lymphocyte antigen 86 n=1 Tax=Bos indicus x Bos taurus TaxID=30522 RepID=A0A4W2IFC0_BOBOX
MKGFAAALLIWTLLSPRRAGGEAWPTHTACRNGNLQVLYQSCADSVDVCLATEKAVLQSSGSSPDPLQDFGFSVDQCARQLKPNINIRFGMVLREDIEQLFLDVALFSKGLSILNFSYPVCEVDLPKFSFCGRRKGGRLPGPAGALQPRPCHRGLCQCHRPLFLSLSKHGQQSRGNSAPPTDPAEREDQQTTQQASWKVPALMSAAGPEVPALPGCNEGPAVSASQELLGVNPAVLRDRPSSLSALLTKLTSFQLLGAQDQIKKLAHKECLVVCLRILVQPCSCSVSSSAHRATGCHSISDAERCRKVGAR